MKQKVGFYLIDKESGWTSFDVCAVVKRHLNQKRVGHAGTLDPFATGLLVVATGKATKLMPYLNKATKTYVAEVTLGETTPTLDPELIDQKTVDTKKDPPSEDAVAAAVASFIGEGMQVPPIFSALKIKGQRAYKLARKGTDVVIPPRPMVVHRATVVAYAYPKVTVELCVGAGFYVRSFARDVAKKLGTLGYCSALRRTMAGDLSVHAAEPVNALTELIDPQYILTNDVLPHTSISADRLNDFSHGRAFPHPGVEGQRYLVLCHGNTIGVGEITHGNLQPRVGL